MKVAIIAPPWLPVPPPAYGGTEAMLDVLARGIQAAGHEVLLFTTGDSTCPVPRQWLYERSLGVSAPAAPAHELRHVIAAYDAVGGYDVVHDHTLAGLFVSDRFPLLPVVTTNHGPFDEPLGELYRRLSPRSALVAISMHQASTFDGAGVAAVIHHGLDVESVPVGAGDGGYVLFLGRMHPDKGPHRAAAIARAAGVPIKIASRVEEQDEVRFFDQELRPLLGDGVEFVGEVGGADKYRLLGGASCLLNPVSWHEPFGMVVIEALACGTPVVAAPLGSMPELIDDGRTGFLRATPEGMVAALGAVDILDRSRCRQEATIRFSMERLAARHLELYETVAGTTRNRPAA